MRLLGIDYGKKRVGIALSDDKGMMAFPKAVVANDNFLFSAIRELVQGHGIETIVVGDSKNYQMADNPIMTHIRRFADELRRDLGVVVIYEPELLSSHQAAQAAHTTGRDDLSDASAAAIILQSYIDRMKFNNPTS
ncbi:MAG TPA: Holliday junction resolvase RuvX [Candidatus Paceibacterota bacterium]